jgi:excinuclease ABC subunit A
VVHANKIKEQLDALRQQGFIRLLIGTEMKNVDEVQGITGKQLDVVVDRLVAGAGDFTSRLADSVETSFRYGEGKFSIQVVDGEIKRFNTLFECSNCEISAVEPQPQLFSFNNPFGACPRCEGFGNTMEIDLDLVIPDKTKSLNQGAIAPWNTPAYRNRYEDLEKAASKYSLNFDTPFLKLTEKHKDFILNGNKEFYGVKGFFEWVEKKKYKLHMRVLMSRYRGYSVCTLCHGSRLRPEATQVRINAKNIAEISKMTIEGSWQFIRQLSLSGFEKEVASNIIEELKKRLNFLMEVGLEYLTLDRTANTLSGGESQRIHLATSLGSALVDALYILDEPSIGLHARDNARLIDILKKLRDLGNTVIVVEHDAEMMQQSDRIVDLGPKAGDQGGEVIFNGTYQKLMNGNGTTQLSLTGQYLKGKKNIPVPAKRRRGNGDWMEIRGASEHNLKKIDTRFPLNAFVCVTGVSGSGKSTLVHDVLYSGLMQLKGRANGRVGKFDKIIGDEKVDSVVMVDQSPIGRTPRSNPVTYMKAFDGIREVLAVTTQAKISKLFASDFSFNVPGGRCETCQGDGQIQVEMQFLADLYLICEVCKGKRYKQKVLDVKYKGKNIDDVLNMTVSEALQFFYDIPKITKKLKVLTEVGLGYLKLGQSATTLSGGEAQRVKLAFYLSQRSDEHILYLFDEPTTGLHFDDIAKLLKCFDRLLEAGHSLLVIEHNLDVIKCADYIIDLGPEAGEKGGEVVAYGQPESIVTEEGSYTGKFLKVLLG